jgi:hypothetical protein
MRSAAPPELREQWNTFQRDALVMAKTLIDAYLTRLDGDGRAPSRDVEDIPIE